MDVESNVRLLFIAIETEGWIRLHFSHFELEFLS